MCVNATSHASDALLSEKSFLTEALPVSLIGMDRQIGRWHALTPAQNAKLMCTYIEVRRRPVIVADRPSSSPTAFSSRSATPNSTTLPTRSSALRPLASLT